MNSTLVDQNTHSKIVFTDQPNGNVLVEFLQHNTKITEVSMPADKAQILFDHHINNTDHRENQ